MNVCFRWLTFASAMVVAGCANYVISVPEPGPGGHDFEMTAVVLGWGAVEDPQVAEACDRGFGMDRVRARTNLGYDLISVITLGFVRPLDLSYRCYTGESPVGSTRD